MKKTIAAVALAVASLAALAAENWVLVMDGDEGTRLIVDVDSFSTAAGDDGTPYIGADFRYVSGGKFKPVFIFVTDRASCARGGGELFARILRDGKWVTRDTYFWSSTGTKMYDHGAQALCTIQAARSGSPSKGGTGV